MKSFIEHINEDLLDDLIGEFPDVVGDIPVKVVKTKPRKKYKPRVLHKGKPPEGFKQYARQAKSNMTLKKVVDMFAIENVAFADNITIDIPLKDLHTIREYDRKIIDGFTGKNTTDEMEELLRSIKRNGIKDPGVVTLHRLKNGNITAILGEGNHRLNIGIKLKLKTMPIRFYYKETF